MINEELCRNILRYGVIVSDQEYSFEYNGVFHFERYYTIEYNNRTYKLVKQDGEFVYFKEVKA